MENDLMFNVLCRIVEFVYGEEMFTWLLYISIIGLTYTEVVSHIKKKKGK